MGGEVGMSCKMSWKIYRHQRGEIPALDELEAANVTINIGIADWQPRKRTYDTMPMGLLRSGYRSKNCERGAADLARGGVNGFSWIYDGRGSWSVKQRN